MVNQQIPPEVLEAMLGLSEQDEEKKLLERQLYLGNMLGRGATDYQGKNTGAGGALSALAQGLQGYGAGKLNQQYQQGTLEGMAKRRGQRKTYFDMLMRKPEEPPYDYGLE